MKSEGLSKTDQKHLVKLGKDALLYRKQGNVGREQIIYDKIQALLDKRNVPMDAGEAVEQVRAYLKRTGWIPGSMQGWI